MPTKNKKLTAYFSHAIAGSGGKKVWDNLDYKLKNCKKAIKVANWIRKNIPELEMYVPGEHEELCHAASSVTKYLTISQVLEVDTYILSTKDFVIVLFNKEGQQSEGVDYEIKAAFKLNKLIFFIEKMNKSTLIHLKNLVKLILNGEDRSGIFVLENLSAHNKIKPLEK